MFGFNELRVENVGDGEGTFVAGTVNQYLDLKHGVTCPIALVYLINEYQKLNFNDQYGWLEAQDAGFLALSALLTSKVSGSIAGILAAVDLGLSPEDLDSYASSINDYLATGVEVGEYTMDDLATMTEAAVDELIKNQE